MKMILNSLRVFIQNINFLRFPVYFCFIVRRIMDKLKFSVIMKKLRKEKN